ncbi:hypothetical protein RRG08_047041 [Elysia crispata]|uniref:Uncharacterized protein n=1 Tax=Elysia crispata TaxID=231223 RepID=A0AAE1AWS8_9GAST|nr:hypothetical protein RRG08_047041 [Elysia crispata]
MLENIGRTCEKIVNRFKGKGVLDEDKERRKNSDYLVAMGKHRVEPAQIRQLSSFLRVRIHGVEITSTLE